MQGSGVRMTSRGQDGSERSHAEDPEDGSLRYLRQRVTAVELYVEL